MEWQTRLRLIAGTFLVTSLLWAGAGLYWWGGSAATAPVPPAMTTDEAGLVQAPTAPVAAQELNQTQVAYTPPASVSAAPALSAPLVIPVQGVKAGQLVDTFTQAREGGLRVHDAIDIMAPRGTPVLAAAAGTVEKLHTSAAGGLTIYLRCDDRRFIHYYAHLDQYAPGLVEGQRVTQGQMIGAVGITGNADPNGPHLHFAVQQTSAEAKWYQPSLALNPYPLLTRH